MSEKKMRIGLALGSGSARGLAHIGVIKALTELNYKPDIISGCSIGALIGAVYIANKLNDLEQWLTSLTLKDVVGFFDVNLSSGGLIVGDRLINILKEYIGNRTIESLPIPFGSVATEITTGREIWFREGPLLEAVRASMSLPGLFAPAYFNEKWLVDGGIVNPVPISLCRAMGADIVVAVNLNGDVVGKHFAPNRQRFWFSSKQPDDSVKVSNRIRKSLRQLFSQFSEQKNRHPGLFDVMASSINIMQDRITRSRMAGDPPEILIEPRLSNIGLLEYYRSYEAIEEGKQSVQRVVPSLQRILSSSN